MEGTDLFTNHSSFSLTILESHSLPIKNSYILKIQGTYALIDWISINLSQFNKIWMWDIIVNLRLK